MSKVKLGDVVERVKEFVDKDNTDLTFYIGGEHFESRSLTIKNRGYINGSTIGPAFHHRFRKGDVLLMSRNPHLRKAGMVDFDGICSDVSYVIRTKDENVIMQKFIPLLFQCDAFWEFAEKNKKGSTNFFLNWSDFEKFEFDLPAIENQKKIVDVLWSIDNTIDTYNNVIKASDELVKSQFIEMFGNLECNSKGYPVHKLSDIASYWNGLTYKPTDTSQDGEGILVLRSSNIQKGKLVFDDNVRVTCPIKEKLFVKENDILMCSRNGSATLVGKTALIQKITEPMTFGAFMMIIRSPYYSFLRTYFDMSAFKSQISTGTSTINQITGNMLNGVIVPVPDMDTIKSFDKFVQQVDKSKLIEIEEAKLYA